MTSPSRRIVLPGALCVALGPFLAGCGGSYEEQVTTAPPPRAPAPPLRPPKPAVTPVDQLMAQLGIDERVDLPEDKAPGTTEARVAVLEFFDSFARGDDTALRSMLSDLDADELDELVTSGAWAQATSEITRIEIQTGQSPDGQECALAVLWTDFDADHQPQLWYYHVNADGTRFDAVAAPPNLIDRLSGTDWIAAWFQILDEERELAYKPDEEFEVPQKDYSEKSRRSSGPSSGPSAPGQPSPGRPTAPPNAPSKRPKKTKRPAPGKGG